MKSNYLIAIFLETLAEASGEAANGICYAALMNHCDIDWYNKFIEAMIQSDLIVLNYDVLKLTDKGWLWANRIKEARKAA